MTVDPLLASTLDSVRESTASALVLLASNEQGRARDALERAKRKLEQVDLPNHARLKRQAAEAIQHAERAIGATVRREQAARARAALRSCLRMGT